VGVSYVFAGLPVTDRDGALVWYERLLGRPADMLPNDAEAVWRLAETASLYVVVDRDRAGGGVVTLVVDDLDACLAEVVARGVVPGPIAVVGDAGRKAIVADPDGNCVAIVEIAASG
jgi:predicted enzyme related to lactoylglutathione lyase